jgi:hypothetical protein
MVIAPRHAQTNHLGGLIMLHKILIGLLCMGGVVLFAIGALGLALGIGPFLCRWQWRQPAGLQWLFFLD